MKEPMKTPNYDSTEGKMKEDREMFGGTGGDGENGNGPCTMAESVGKGDGGMRTTGDGKNHWSRH